MELDLWKEYFNEYSKLFTAFTFIKQYYMSKTMSQHNYVN